ncbi:hypothetical protein KFL_006840020 [Klebsormidium nitens]|uniref:Uncharacterized protein n=1 Tax=Klebsormidium nitens TaxID=105231 RepID=A0A1Y1IMU7_KLENI|nr:hypothetical protein KFL_006840020 [Klebsormidium nitens]|eukprot:GAQ90779.1 hypothetical protein KFL_006840020 [Klebsormidium nitens]
MLEALDANGEGGENRLNKTELFTIYYPNLLVLPDRKDQDLIFGDWAKGRQLRDWMRRIPLLKDLPVALAAYFMDDEDMPTARRRGLNMMEYLSGKISERVSHNS